ncbi:hypothetical protein DO97_17320 [Neosynechococcus sphagnicola sy1]|uniref:Uncharacterized protein n=1 Tax=Neosynechococcus sphagnicola sy1 TaxID=1497020 RepID=A0A098TI16_9CYAN|nr:hypothetical protein [Neosynechococcus sphagnicola]KGF71602.1 hypothetical protein DO97_17320 [Neosynechococcus sphagnicola sy1]
MESTELTEVLKRLDDIAAEQHSFDSKLDKLSAEQEKFSADQEKFNDRFSNYQQATQWVVQLAFTLIASATLTVIITAIFKR